MNRPWQPGDRVYAVNGIVAHTIAGTHAPAFAVCGYAVTVCGYPTDEWWQGNDRFAHTLPDCKRCTRQTAQ